MTGTISSKNSFIFLTLLLTAIVIGVIHAASLSFVNDDAFVSFRYAKNFIRGFGLVFNQGEKVEGYTNFLWTMIIALGLKLNFDPVTFSTRLGIFFYGCNLLLFGYASWKLNANKKDYLFLLPLTTIALCLHRDFNVYATSGLETSMFTFLVSLGMLILILKEDISAHFIAGLTFVLAMMTRPDGVIFFATSFIFILLTRPKIIKPLATFLFPSVLIFLPYWIWRYTYYGFFFPNSFYAKSIDLPYYSQGLIYIWMYLKTYYALGVIPILIFIVITQKRKLFFSSGILKNLIIGFRTTGNISRTLLLPIMAIICYSFFIVRFGGDFMFARFLIPLTPAFFFIIEQLTSKITPKKIGIVLSLFVITATIFRNDLFSKDIIVDYVADEPQYYTDAHLMTSKKDGELLNKYFVGTPVRIAFWAGQMKLVYYADPFYALESSAGLTDAGIAHQELSQRGRPGHEKTATDSYLVEKKINFYFKPSEQYPDGRPILDAISFDSLIARIIIYDNAIMDPLGKYPDVRFINFPWFLDQYIKKIPSFPVEKVRQDFVFFKNYYFDFNGDRERKNIFESYLASAQQ